MTYLFAASASAANPFPARQVAVKAITQRTAFYRTIWRWHFYAGLFVMPFILILSVTGTDQLNGQWFRHVAQAAARDCAWRPATASRSGANARGRSDLVDTRCAAAVARGVAHLALAGRTADFAQITARFGVVGAGIGARVWLKPKDYGEKTTIR